MKVNLSLMEMAFVRSWTFACWNWALRERSSFCSLNRSFNERWGAAVDTEGFSAGLADCAGIAGSGFDGAAGAGWATGAFGAGLRELSGPVRAAHAVWAVE